MSKFQKILDSRFVEHVGVAYSPSLDFVSTDASSEFDLAAPAAAVSAAALKVIATEGHKVVGASDDQLLIAVVTKKTWLSWETLTSIEITPTSQGSHVAIFMKNMPGRPVALLDGAKNKKKAKNLGEQIQAAF